MFLFDNDYAKAFVELNTVLRADVYNAEAYFLKGMCYKYMKDTAKALSNFQTAVQTNPKYYDAFMQLGVLYDEKNDRIAIQYFENARKIDTLNLEPLYAQAMFFQKRNEFAEAKKLFRRALKINKDYALAFYNTGWMLLQEDSTEKAIREFERAINVKPDYAEAYYNKGLCHEILGNYKQAFADYGQALEFNNDLEMCKTAEKRVKAKM